MSSVVIRRDVGGGLLSSNNEPGVPHISDVRDAYVSVFTDNQVQILHKTFLLQCSLEYTY